MSLRAVRLQLQSMLRCVPMPLFRRYYYLRSVGTDPRKLPSDLAAAFPHLAADVALPDSLLPPGSVFSTVLRIGSGA